MLAWVFHVEQRAYAVAADAAQHFVYVGLQADDGAGRQKRLAVGGIEQRAAARGDNQPLLRRQLVHQLALIAAKDRLPFDGKDGGNGLALAFLDQSIHIHKGTAQAVGHIAPDAGFARAHEAGEHDVACGKGHGVACPSASG